MPGGRPRKYRRPEEAAAAHALRERARRSRTIAVERDAVAELLQAVEDAAAAGHAIARLVKSRTPDSLLRNLAHWFRRLDRPIREEPSSPESVPPWSEEPPPAGAGGNWHGRRQHR